jgi:hypothetical protein
MSVSITKSLDAAGKQVNRYLGEAGFSFDFGLPTSDFFECPLTSILLRDDYLKCAIS